MRTPSKNIKAPRQRSRQLMASGSLYKCGRRLPFAMQELCEAQLLRQLRGIRTAHGSPLREFCKLLLQILRWAAQQEVSWRWAYQEQIVQTRGPREHHVEVQPPVLILLCRAAALVPPAINDHAQAKCAKRLDPPPPLWGSRACLNKFVPSSVKF